MKLSIYREVELSLKAACRHLLLASSLTSILLLHLYSRDFPFCSRPLTEKKEEGGRLLLLLLPFAAALALYVIRLPPSPPPRRAAAAATILPMLHRLLLHHSCDD